MKRKGRKARRRFDPARGSGLIPISLIVRCALARCGGCGMTHGWPDGMKRPMKRRALWTQSSRVNTDTQFQPAALFLRDGLGWTVRIGK